MFSKVCDKTGHSISVQVNQTISRDFHHRVQYQHVSISLLHSLAPYCASQIIKFCELAVNTSNQESQSFPYLFLLHTLNCLLKLVCFYFGFIIRKSEYIPSCKIIFSFQKLSTCPSIIFFSFL